MNSRLKKLIFMALCCDLGVFAKKLIVPAANLLTDALHIPGGIGAGFSLLFIVVACACIPKFGAGTLMGAVQSVIALGMGTVGSMGVLSPVGYIVPAFVIDCVMWAARRLSVPIADAALAANALGSVAACLAANLIVFRLRGAALLLYVCLSAFSGAVCGLLAGACAKKIAPLLEKGASS